MEALLRNTTVNSSRHEACECDLENTVMLSLVDIFTVLIGQPVIARLLWIAFVTNKTPDILNSNLALFHNFQYLVSIVHLTFLFAFPLEQVRILKFLFVYAQIGGPTSLSLICLQRYVAVIYPSSYPLLKRYRYCEVCAATVWFLSLPTAFASAFAAQAVSTLDRETLNNVPLILMVCMILMMARCSIKIVWMLRKRGPGRDKLHPAKKRAFTTIAATTAITLSFYIPVTLLQRLTAAGRCEYDCVVTPRCIFLLSAASVVHPLLYLSTQRKLFTCFKWERKT